MLGNLFASQVIEFYRNFVIVYKYDFTIKSTTVQLNVWFRLVSDKNLFSNKRYKTFGYNRNYIHFVSAGGRLCSHICFNLVLSVSGTFKNFSCPSSYFQLFHFILSIHFLFLIKQVCKILEEM